jgi:probable HAF family extracellular repeat protein
MNCSRSTYFIALVILAALTIPAALAAQGQSGEERRSKHHRYKLVDLGTFGGPESYINPAFTFGSHNQINRYGMVVGGAATSIPTTVNSDGFVCGGLDGTVPFVNHAFNWENGEITDMGALPGGSNCSVATSVNARGEIVGRSENGVIDPAVGVSQIRAVLWKDGELRDLGTLGGNGSSASAINNRGQVVGFAFNAIPDPLSFIYFGLAGSPNGTQTRAFLWQEGILQDLKTLGGPDAVALFANERGEVAGFSYTNSTPNPVTPLQPGLPTIHPFVWTREGGMQDLGSLGGTVGWANCECGGFNNRGQLVGLSTLTGDQIADPFLWDGEKLIDLFTETIGGSPLAANAINDAGVVAGGASFPGRSFDAFLWRNGVASDLGTVGGDGCSWARAINSRGQVVGQSFACDGSFVRSFLWEDGSMVDLNTLIARHSNLQLVDTLAINDRGEIAGLGLPPGCTLAIGDTQCGHGFLLIPCDKEDADKEGCKNEGEDADAAIQDWPAVVNQPTSAMEGGLSPREIAGRMRTRFGRSHGFGFGPGRLANELPRLK